MFTCFLKRGLPFLLTLLVGSALGSIFNNTARPTNGSPNVLTLRESNIREVRTKCNMSARKTYASQTLAIINFKPEPRYTDAARRNETTGTVRLLVTLGADGKVSDVETIESLPYGLTESAIRAAKGIQFTPATRNGQPVDEKKEIAFYFTSE